MTPRELDELYLRVGQAWELKARGSPYFFDACGEIENWHERRRLARLEREHADAGRVVRVLRETRPDRVAA